jgi:Signal transduction histidine kinase
VEKLQEDVKKGKDLLEETREFNKLITEFFSNISHELKTPLNVIFSAIQLLNHYKENSIQDLEEKQDKYFKIMKQNCYRLMRLINNLLDMTRLDSGFLKLNMVEFNIINVVEDIVMSVAPYIESKGIGIIFDTDVEERTMVFDPDKIERIILNLLSNAVKFTECGGEIFVNITNTEKEIFISVKDTGAGIPEDKLSMIFDRFMQVDKTMVREHEGSGIGLSLVKSFVEMHKGTVVVKSKLGCGSEFIVKLPVNLLHDKVTEQNNYYESNIERINIEFSDIYSEINM